MTDVLPRRVHIGYASGSLATGTFGTVPGLLLLPYLTDTTGVAAGVAGLLVLVPKAWDVLVNPVAGRISDKWGGQRGRRRHPGYRWMGLFCGALIVVAPPESTVVCFTPDQVDVFVLADELAMRGVAHPTPVRVRRGAGQHPPERDRLGGAAGGRVRPGPGGGGRRGAGGRSRVAA